MESFSIACTTCRAQLRVRDRSAVGQILTCPKCGSMVLVEAPPEESAATSRASPPPLPKSGRPPADATRVEQAVNLADTVDDPTLYGSVPMGVETEPVGEPSPEDIAELDVEDHLAAPPFQPPPTIAEPLPTAAGSWIRWLAISAAAVLGIGLAIGIFSWLSGGNVPPTPAPERRVASRCSPRSDAVLTPEEPESQPESDGEAPQEAGSPVDGAPLDEPPEAEAGPDVPAVPEQAAMPVEQPKPTEPGIPQSAAGPSSPSNHRRSPRPPRPID